jgi:hypothetical protein
MCMSAGQVKMPSGRGVELKDHARRLRALETGEKVTA